MSSPMAGDEYVKIERLEAELANVRQERDKISTSSYHLIESWKEQLDKMEAELADWQRHGVKVSVDCETCDGQGWIAEPPTYNQSIDCPDCGGTGKKLRDGSISWKNVATGEWMVGFPAERLENISREVQ